MNADELDFWTRNFFETNGETITIDLWCAQCGWLKTIIDSEDLSKLSKLRCTWRANPARKSQHKKHYATGKRNGKTILMHRIIMNEPKAVNGTPIEVHHGDNDGLNNKRSNLSNIKHIDNMRERFPQRNWVAYDENLKRIEVFKTIVKIGESIREHFALTRQQLWKIRTGGTLASKAAKAYWNAVQASYPQLFPHEHRSTPWTIGAAVIAPFCPKKEKGKTMYPEKTNRHPALDK